MNKQEIYNFLRDKNIWYKVTEHKPIFNMEELNEVNFTYPKVVGKNLFIRDDKKRNYYLITVKGDKKISLKKFREKNNTRALNFASETDLMDSMGLIPGSVTPFGLLNDKKLKVVFYLDKDFLKDSHLIGVHPNENTATVWLKAEDLIDIVKEHGNQVYIVEMDF